jgi:hypothetical protein
MGLVFGLHGAKRSGKDYFYQVIKSRYPDLDIRKVAYADPIKKEVCRIFELQDEAQYDLFKQSKVEYQLPGYLTHNVTGRQVVREIGMLMRGYNEQQFVRYVEDEIIKHPKAIWFITDLRFRNELKSVKLLVDGVVVKIKRPGKDYDGHPSEIEIEDKFCDTIIMNTGTIVDYERQIIDTFTKYYSRAEY